MAYVTFRTADEIPPDCRLSVSIVVRAGAVETMAVVIDDLQGHTSGLPLAHVDGLAVGDPIGKVLAALHRPAVIEKDEPAIELAD